MSVVPRLGFYVNSAAPGLPAAGWLEAVRNQTLGEQEKKAVSLTHFSNLQHTFCKTPEVLV